MRWYTPPVPVAATDLACCTRVACRNRRPDDRHGLFCSDDCARIAEACCVRPLPRPAAWTWLGPRHGEPQVAI